MMNVSYGPPPYKEPIQQPMDQEPFCAIGRMRMSDGTHWYAGTGSLITKRYIITAAHVLANKTGGMISFGFELGDNGNGARTVNIARAAIPAAYPAAPGSDIGVAQLAGDYNGTFGFLFNLDGQGNDRKGALTSVTQKGSITIAGYPAAGPVSPDMHPDVVLDHQYAKTGPVADYHLGNHSVSYQFDTRGGESGSPLFAMPSGRCQLIGVHTGWDVKNDRQVGEGTLLTDEKLRWVKQAIHQLETAHGGPFVLTV